MSAKHRGRFIWHELNTTDVAGAEKFYRALTGWGVQNYENNPAYKLWTTGTVGRGGLMLLPDDAKAMGAPPNWLVYIAVPDVDASVRQAESLGAKTVVPAQDIPGTGRFAIVTDPQGAPISLFAPAPRDNEPPEAGPVVGEFSWHDLATTDSAAAWSFYEKMFGWKKGEGMDMGPQGTYQMFGRDAFTYGGMYNMSAGMPGRPAWLSYILVKNVDAVLAKITALGGRVVNGPMDVPGGDRVVMCVDPQGAAFALHSKGAAMSQPAQAKPAAKAAAKPKPAAARVKAKTRPKAKTTSKVKTKAKAKTKARPKPKAKSRVKARTKARPKAKPKTKSRKPARRARSKK